MGKYEQVQGGSSLPKEVTDKREVPPVWDRRDRGDQRVKRKEEEAEFH
jgi:hypothetical protein